MPVLSFISEDVFISMSSVVSWTKIVCLKKQVLTVGDNVVRSTCFVVFLTTAEDSYKASHVCLCHPHPPVLQVGNVSKRHRYCCNLLANVQRQFGSCAKWEISSERDSSMFTKFSTGKVTEMVALHSVALLANTKWWEVSLATHLHYMA